MNTIDTKKYMLDSQCLALGNKLDALFPREQCLTSVFVHDLSLWMADASHPGGASAGVFHASKKIVRLIMTSTSIDTDLYIVLTDLGLNTESSLMASLRYD